MTESISSFAALDLPPPLLASLSDVGYETPTPIQAACIPPLLAGLDLIGEAQTGTGKTAAFALPLLAHIDLANNSPQALVLTPTRELAIQVAEAFQKYAQHLPGFHVLPLYGGQSMVVQLRALKRGPHVIVGTPGRIMDHLERRSLQLDGLRNLVLDEADEMLRMGFIDAVSWILEHTPATRRTALFSATMPAPIRRIAQRYLRQPQEIKIRSATTTVAAVKQSYWQGRSNEKLDALTRILEAQDDLDAAIIFVRTRTATVELAEKLEARGHETAALNGDMPQGLREQVVDKLKKGAIDVIVATDVAARGLDVPRISHVINYDIPYDVEAYIHRIGRTGRAGRTGAAILFIAPREIRMLKAIERATRQAMEPVQLPTPGDLTQRRISQFKQQIIEVLATENLDFFYQVVREMENGDALATRQIAAALAFLAQRERPLQTDDDLPEPASPKLQRQGKAQGHGATAPERDGAYSSGRPAAQPPRRNSNAPSRLYRLEVGRNQGVTPREIVGALANEGDIDGACIGQINLYDDYATVELPQLDKNVLGKLERIRIKRKQLHLSIIEGKAEQPGPRRKTNPARQRRQ